MEVERIKEKIDKVIEEIQEFAGYEVKGASDVVEYLYTARAVANSYDRMIESSDEIKIYDEINLIRHYLKENPHYLDFHKEP
ncbi:MAG: hypothetical protein IKF17_02210 [Clostridia bacterium]|nr:hypothetical protein [Clostridia bacterium]